MVFLNRAKSSMANIGFRTSGQVSYFWAHSCNVVSKGWLNYTLPGNIHTHHSTGDMKFMLITQFESFGMNYYAMDVHKCRCWDMQPPNFFITNVAFRELVPHPQLMASLLSTMLDNVWLHHSHPNFNKDHYRIIFVRLELWRIGGQVHGDVLATMWP